MTAQTRIEQDGRKACRRMRRSVLLVSGIGLAVLIGVSGYFFKSSRQRALRAQCYCQLSQLAKAMMLYHQDHGHFPPAYLANDDGTAIHSWRILILPYVGGQDLYDTYRFDEPWNGPNNILLADKMPTIYCCRDKPASNSVTPYVVIVGEDTVFPFHHPTSLEDFRDGLENTTILAALADSDIIWTEPRDLSADMISFTANHVSPSGVSDPRRPRPLVFTSGDGKSYSLNRHLDPKTLKAFTTIQAGDEISMVKFRNSGFESLGSSAVTDQSLRDFGHWNKVTALWLSNAKVTDAGIEYLRDATRLRRLNLSGTEVTDAALDHLKELDLSSLNLHQTRVTPRGVLALVASSDYIEIDFPGGRVSMVENAHGFQLRVRSPAITGDQLEVFGIVRAPAFLSLGGTALTDQCLTHLGRFLDLRSLHISDTQVADVGLTRLAGLASLQELDLSGLQGVTDDGVKHLEILPDLKWLHLSDTKVTEIGISSLRQALPNCKITHSLFAVSGMQDNSLLGN